MWAEVRSRNPRTLNEAVRIALDFNELLRPKKKFGWDGIKPGGRERYNNNGSSPQLMELGSLKLMDKKNTPGKFNINKVKCFKCSKFNHMMHGCNIKPRNKDDLFFSFDDAPTTKAVLSTVLNEKTDDRVDKPWNK